MDASVLAALDPGRPLTTSLPPESEVMPRLDTRDEPVGDEGTSDTHAESDAEPASEDPRRQFDEVLEADDARDGTY
jgi:hypothetical protein